MTTTEETAGSTPPQAQPEPDAAKGPTGQSVQLAPAPHKAGRQAEPHVQLMVHAPNVRRFWVVLWLIVLLAFGAAGAIPFVLSHGNTQSTSDAYVDGRGVRISPRVSGQVMALRVDDNVYVKAGEVLLEIDPADYQAKVDQATAALATAESAVKQTQAVVLRAKAAVGEAEASARAADTEAKRRASDYRRYSAMGTDGVSEQQLETAKAAADAAADQREAAAKKRAAAEAELNVAMTNIKTAESQVTAAQAQLHLAELQLQYTKVVAPVSGLVTNRNVEKGAFVSTGQPLMAIVPEERWVVANFKEVQLQRMHAGQRAEVRVDAYPSMRLVGHVQSMQAGTGSRFQLLPPENATGNWVKVVQRLPVKIVFEPDQPELARLAQGMSVVVTVETRDRGDVSEPRPAGLTREAVEK